MHIHYYIKYFTAFPMLVQKSISLKGLIICKENLRDITVLEHFQVALFSWKNHLYAFCQNTFISEKTVKR